MEKNEEIAGGNLDFGARIYDGRTARFLSVDPYSARFPEKAPYQFAGNSPIKYIDMNGEFQFDPETLKLLKDKYPTAYKYLTQTSLLKSGNVLELTKSNTIIENIISNTYNSNLGIIKNPSQKPRKWPYNTKRVSGILADHSNDDKFKLTKDDIVTAFTAGSGPKIEIKAALGHLSLTDAGGYNAGEDGKDYSSPIELNVGLFENVENASNTKEKQAALLALTSVLIHEYIEDFADDNWRFYDPETNEHDSFGAAPAQYSIYNYVPPGYDGKGEYEMNLYSLDNILNNGGDPTVVPNLPEEN
jgi:RHS repeat-associated protein